MWMVAGYQKSLSHVRPSTFLWFIVACFYILHVTRTTTTDVFLTRLAGGCFLSVGTTLPSLPVFLFYLLMNNWSTVINYNPFPIFEEFPHIRLERCLSDSVIRSVSQCQTQRDDITGEYCSHYDGFGQHTSWDFHRLKSFKKSSHTDFITVE